MGKRRDARAEAETRARLDGVAREIRARLATAGLPVQPEGPGSEAGPGVVVGVADHETVADARVWVGWSVAPSLRHAVDQAVSGTEQDTWVRAYAFAVLSTMTEAIRGILTAGGFTVAVRLEGLSIYTLYVLDVPAELREKLGMS